MKKSAGKQMITIAGGVLACSMQMMGCYPLAPAYFAAAFLEGVNGVWLTAAMYIGMLYFMPLTATVKYAVALLVTAGAIKLVEWANEGCPAFLAAILTAITTMILSFCGGLLEWKDQPEVLAVFLEGIFVFGAVILLNRGIHFFYGVAGAWKQDRAGTCGQRQGGTPFRVCRIVSGIVTDFYEYE